VKSGKVAQDWAEGRKKGGSPQYPDPGKRQEKDCLGGLIERLAVKGKSASPESEKKRRDQY